MEWLTCGRQVSPTRLWVNWKREVHAIEGSDEIVGAPNLLENLQNARLSMPCISAIGAVEAKAMLTF